MKKHNVTSGYGMVPCSGANATECGAEEISGESNRFATAPGGETQQCIAMTHLFTADQLKVERDRAGLVAAYHSQLQIISINHVENLEENHFTFMQIFHKRLLTKIRETVE